MESTMVSCKAVIFRQVPIGTTVSGKDLTIETREFDVNQDPPSGGITTKNIYASFELHRQDPKPPPAEKSSPRPFDLGQPLTNTVIAKVLKSDNEKFKSA